MPFFVTGEPEIQMIKGRHVWMDRPGRNTVYLVSVKSEIEKADGGPFPIKIGKTTQPEHRFGQMQSAHWDEVQVVESFCCPYAALGDIERACHRRFEPYRLRSEWFMLTPEAAKIGVALEIKRLGFVPMTTTEVKKRCCQINSWLDVANNEGLAA